MQIRFEVVRRSVVKKPQVAALGANGWRQPSIAGTDAKGQNKAQLR